ncbi:O-antigen ligase [uncultured Phascolarctobacterium sp.]|uniref:O-antigen ligase family protein n=1 Tax=uncultured Phascolarctobacterium sp. TaxID=512296 RepID=UPI0025F203ED|nr:O-antigen ligase family protein [uncultured Phascolarctobacterium sp.]
MAILSFAALFIVSLLIFYKFNVRSYDSERLLLWESAIKMFFDYPVLGVGLHRWSEYYISGYISPLAKEPGLPHPHNLYLFLLSERGLVGFVSYLALILWQLKVCCKNVLRNMNVLWTYENVYTAIIIGMLVHELVDVNATLRYHMLIYFFLWGILCLQQNFQPEK